MQKRLKYALFTVMFITALFPISTYAAGSPPELPEFLTGFHKNLPVINTLHNLYSFFGIRGQEELEQRRIILEDLTRITPTEIEVDGVNYNLVHYYSENLFALYIDNQQVWRSPGHTIMSDNSVFREEVFAEFIGFALRAEGDNFRLTVLYSAYLVVTFFPDDIRPTGLVQWINHNTLPLITNDTELTILSPPPNEPGNGDGDFNFPSLEEIIDFIVHIFIPRESFWQDHFDRLDGRLREKLPFQTYIDTIGRLREVSGRLDNDPSIFDITYELNGQEFQLDIGRHIGPHLHNLRILVTGFYVLLLAYYNYRQVMFLIRGRNYQSGRCDH